MDMLRKFEFLEELSLENNHMQGLPRDLSSLKYLANLNVQKIAFADFKKCVLSLATLPRLRSLYVSL